MPSPGGLAPPHRLRFRCHIAAALALSVITPAVSAADDRGWDYQPYQIHAVLAIDVPGGLSQHLADELPKHLQRRAQAAISPLWSLNVELATGTMRYRVFSEIAMSGDEPPAEFPAERDKLLLLAVRWRPNGFELTAREFDRYVERWGVPIRTICRQEQALPEQLFAIAWQAVAPLAQLEIDPDDEQRVRLMPRGAALVRKDSTTPSLKPGDVFLPIFRRTMRGGEVVEGGIQVVPWTYIEVAESEGGEGVGSHFLPPAGPIAAGAIKNETRPRWAHEEETIVARIHSANRRPFGVRRQGYVEQLAIGLRAEPAETVLQLHSRTSPDKPLVGYQVFSQNTVAGVSDPASNDAVTLLGSTDRSGKLAIPPGDTRIRTLYLKNGGQLLARLPIVPGADAQIDVPLPDDDPRLAAESRLAALREELIDVVARRNILMARTRQKIEQSDFLAAQKLLAEADQLPGRSQFNLTLTTTARTLRSEDPQIQRRIDQLVEATQTVMNQYLDLRPINQLHDELRAAQGKGT